jgi:hypothetical protein
MSALIEEGEMQTGRGLGQQQRLGSLSSTRWCCRIDTITSLLRIYPDVLRVLEVIVSEDSKAEVRNKCHQTVLSTRSFGFVLILHLMLDVMGCTKILSECLQSTKLNFVRAVDLIAATKGELNSLRTREKYDDLLKRSIKFCRHVGVDLPEDFLEAMWTPGDNVSFSQRAKSGDKNRSNADYYFLQVHQPVFDKLSTEFEARFSDELTTIMQL